MRIRVATLLVTIILVVATLSLVVVATPEDRDVRAVGCDELIDMDTAVDAPSPDPPGPPDHAKNPDCAPPPGIGPTAAVTVGETQPFATD